MSASDEIRQEYAARLESVFGDNPYPDSGDDSFKGWEIQKAFEGYRWKELPLELINQYRHDTHMLPESLYLYFLPAFLRAILLNPRKTRTLHAGLVSFDLMPFKKGNKAARKMRAVMTLMTPEQFEYILDFFSEYEDLFPEGEFDISDEQWDDLDRAIDFWEETYENALEEAQQEEAAETARKVERETAGGYPSVTEPTPEEIAMIEADFDEPDANDSLLNALFGGDFSDDDFDIEPDPEELAELEKSGLVEPDEDEEDEDDFDDDDEDV